MTEENPQTEEVKEPLPNQPRLDRLVEIIAGSLTEAAIEEAYINELDFHLPCIIVRNEDWAACAELLKNHDELKLDFLSNLSGVDQETHFEVVYHLTNFDTKHEYCVKVKTDRDEPSIHSIAHIWEMANWNEREVFDLFGIDFPGHPDMRRIMMPDDWVGHPLRKDYEPIDPEV